jgi:hypothetical protein
MHQLIRVVVATRSNEEATSIAGGLLKGSDAPLFGPFDYGTTMDAGGRWSDSMPEVVQETGSIRADTEKGRELIETAWTKQNKRLKREFDALKEAFENDVTFEQVLSDARIEGVDIEQYNPLGLAQSEDELSETYSTSIRYAMSELGSYRGPAINLYNQYGTGIRQPDQYRGLISNIEEGTGQYEELSEESDWYVAPVDVHY